ncbi:transposase [Amycolatopsis jejuensis]|uniref:transposase n=1 Tax=Amycolatopsis jejuensis TaxID=330084 RepID=UPI00138E4F67|nr:transposase [Amycolatopsis jejuensis]
MKHYPAEFKADAVALNRSRPGATIESVAEGLGVNSETLRGWIELDDRRRPESPAATEADPAVSDVPEDEAAALRKRIRELEEERDILRKVTRHFTGKTRR